MARTQWVRTSSFSAAYDVIQMKRGSFRNGHITAGMSEYKILASIDVNKSVDPRSIPWGARTVGKGSFRKVSFDSGGGESVSYTTVSDLSVDVGFSIDGMNELIARFGQITDNVREAARKILVESAGRIQIASLERVPVESWALYAAWYPNNIEDAVYVDGDNFRMELGYASGGTAVSGAGVPYAWRQHEDASYQHPVRSELGRTRSEWKFLEYPANEERAHLLDHAMRDFHTAIATMGGVGSAVLTTPMRPGSAFKSGGKPVLRKKR